MLAYLARFLLGACVLALALAPSAPPVAAQAATPEIVDYTLDNGLRVVLVVSRRAPVVAVDIWYHVGGADDPPGRSGFAHLFEHLMFQGTPEAPRGAFDAAIARAGGNNNATTRMDITNYFSVVPAHQLPLLLWLEADRMRSLDIDADNFGREREVVKEEYRERYENRAYAPAVLRLYELVFAYAPYQRAPIGSIADLDAARLEDVLAFHATYYKPNNATLVVAGDIDVEVTRALIDESFGLVPPSAPAPALPAYVPPRRTAPVEVSTADPNARIPATFIGYAGPARSHPDFLALEVLSWVLSGGSSGRLDRALIETQLAAGVGASEQGFQFGSLYSVSLVPNPGVEPALLQQVYDDEIARIQQEGVTDTELQTAINQIRADRIRGRESALGLAESVHSAIYYAGDPATAFAEADRYRELTAADLQRVIATYLDPASRVIIHVTPGAEAAR